MSVKVCPVCSGTTFKANTVLWPALVETWELSESEVDYINRQQGLVCSSCGSNLRSMALAQAFLKAFGYTGNLEKFCQAFSNRKLRVLEINPAGTLTSTLAKLPGHKLISYPDYDMRELNLKSGSYDIVVHSDTLEHIDLPVQALEECRRVLKPGGRCLFTVPIIVGRMSRSRAGLPPSFHGNESDIGSDLMVQTEFGSDFWTTVLKAGFETCVIHSLEYPAGLAIEANS